MTFVPLTHVPFYQLLGLEIERADGAVTVRLPFRTELGNSRGEVHGGAISALFDVAFGQTLRDARDDIVTIATVGMTLNYLEPAHGFVLARAHVVRRGGSIAVLEGAITDSTGATVACALGTFRVFTKPKADASAIKS